MRAEFYEDMEDDPWEVEYWESDDGDLVLTTGNLITSGDL